MYPETNSQYTMTVQEMVEYYGIPMDLDSYPIFDESYRGQLNSKIYNHFWFREIGLETPEMFNHYLKMRLNEKMPYYNELYRTTLFKFDPLSNTSYMETYKRLSEGKTENENIGYTSGSAEDELRGSNKTVGNSQSDTAHEGENANETSGTSKTIDHSKTTDEKNTVTDTDALTTDNKTTLRTDDLTQQTDGEREQTEVNHEDTTTSERFYDAPQDQLSPSLDYLTTQNNKSGNTDGTKTTNEDMSETVKNTGTQNTTENGTTKNEVNTTSDEAGESITDGTSDTTTSGNLNATDSYNDHSETSNEQRALNEQISNSKKFDMTKGKSSQDMKNDEFYQRQIHGRISANPTNALQMFRDAIINIDEMIIAELNSLFMGVY